MKILIVGGSGLVGGNCLAYFVRETNWEVIATHKTFPTEQTTYFNATDLSDPANFDVVNFQPNVIIHCAALSWVDRCEDYPKESKEKSVVPAKNMINLAKEIQAKLVFISTDYLFDGNDGPYAEVAIPNPLNVYGKHKLEVEGIIQEELVDYLICRITNVFGEEIKKKNFIANFLKQISNGVRTIKLPNDQFSTPVGAYDVAKAIWLLLENEKKGIYHLSNSEYKTRYEIAQEVLSVIPVPEFHIEQIYTVDMDVSTPRPLLGGLIADKFLSEFPAFTFYDH